MPCCVTALTCWMALQMIDATRTLTEALEHSTEVLITSQHRPGVSDAEASAIGGSRSAAFRTPPMRTEAVFGEDSTNVVMEQKLQELIKQGAEGLVWVVLTGPVGPA